MNRWQAQEIPSTQTVSDFCWGLLTLFGRQLLESVLRPGKARLAGNGRSPWQLDYRQAVLRCQ